MPSVVTTSIVVQFSQGDSAGVLSVEVDDRENGLNGGKTQFLPAQPVWLLLYKTDNVTLDYRTVSMGSLSPASGLPTPVTVSKTEDITFAGENTATLKYPISDENSLSFVWIGNSQGNVTVVPGSQTTVKLPDPDAGDPPQVGIARVTYNTKAYPFKIAHTLTDADGLTEYGIVAFFSGSTP